MTFLKWYRNYNFDSVLRSFREQFRSYPLFTIEAFYRYDTTSRYRKSVIDSTVVVIARGNTTHWSCIKSCGEKTICTAMNPKCPMWMSGYAIYKNLKSWTCKGTLLHISHRIPSDDFPRLKKYIKKAMQHIRYASVMYPILPKPKMLTVSTFWVQKCC